MSSQGETLFGRPPVSGSGDEAQWLSVSDLMAGLMMVFMLISAGLLQYVLIERDRVHEIAVSYQENKKDIYDLLMEEFKEDLARWDASIDEEDLSVEFHSPDVLFGSGQTDIRPEFASLLDNFFPRYADILLRFRQSIQEVRIEGHTDSVWAGAETEIEAYFMNMVLSQGRTRSVLNYLLEMEDLEHSRDWLKSTFSAVGFSSSRLILDEEQQEDRTASRRVAFRIVTNAEEQIAQIIRDLPSAN